MFAFDNMTTKLTILLILLITLSSFAQFRVSYEPIWQNPDASVLHFVGSAFLATKLEDCGLKWWQADLITLGLGTAWEVKDGLLPYERFGYAGGEGFGRGDMICNLSGVVFNRLLRVAIKRIRRV